MGVEQNNSVFVDIRELYVETKQHTVTSFIADECLTPMRPFTRPPGLQLMRSIYSHEPLPIHNHPESLFNEPFAPFDSPTKFVQCQESSELQLTGMVSQST